MSDCMKLLAQFAVGIALYVYVVCVGRVPAALILFGCLWIGWFVAEGVALAWDFARRNRRSR